MEVAVSSAAGIGVYAQVPAESVRAFVDEAFPWFAKCPQADIPPFGKWHRFERGHDLILDIPSTLKDYGVKDAIRHSGHVILTDFPTKQGIPIPGFSRTGLGDFLVKHGIPRGWLSINIVDGSVGILSIAEGHNDLAVALAGELDMSTSTFFDTFGEGSVELLLAAATRNPLLAAGGIENIAAGFVSTWKTYTLDINPLEFFGGALGSAVIGALLTTALTRNEETNRRVRKSLCNAIKSGAIGGLFTLHTLFGFGAVLGLASTQFGACLAMQREKERQVFFSIDQGQFEIFLRTLGEGNPEFLEEWKAIKLSKVFIDSPPILASEVSFRLPVSGKTFSEKRPILEQEANTFTGTPPYVFGVNVMPKLPNEIRVFREE